MNINLKRIGQIGNGLAKPSPEASYAGKACFRVYERDGLQGASLFAKMQGVARLSLISLVFACSTLYSRGGDAVPSVDSLVQIIAASESQLSNLKVTSQYAQTIWDESSGKWKDAGDASLTTWLDGKPGGKMRIDFQHERLLWTHGAKPFSEESYIKTYNGNTAQRLERYPDAFLKEHPRALPRGRGTIEGERPYMGVADTGSGWIASLYGVEEDQKRHLSELMTSMSNSLTIAFTNYMASPYYIVFTNCVVSTNYIVSTKDAASTNCIVSTNYSVSTNYIFSTNYNGIACVQLTLKEYPIRVNQLIDPSRNTQGWGLAQIRMDWFLDPSRNYAVLGYKRSSGWSFECVVGELIEPAPGVFYPKKAAYYVAARNGKPESLLTYEGSSIVANDTNFSDDIFTIQWPTGTWVHDEVLGTTFEMSPPLGEFVDKLDSQVSAKQKTVNLTDGRNITSEVVANDGHRLQFRAKGWNYNLPAYMIATGTLAESVKVQRVEITKDSIVTPEGKLTSFQELMAFLDNKATQSSPVILVLSDGMSSWSETRRQEFGKAYGSMHSHPNVGVEGPWPEKWLPGGLPGDPGRKLPKK